MATYKQPYYGKRKTNVFRVVIMTLTIMAILVTIGLGIRFYILDKNIKENKLLITTTKKENSTLESQVPKLKEDTEKLQLQVEDLKDTLWKYEPIVIPNSMK